MKYYRQSQVPEFVRVITLAALLFPYVGFLPGFDVQPFFVAVVLLALAISASVENIRVKKSVVVFIGIGLFLLTFRLLVQYSSSDSTDSTITSFSISVFHLLVILVCACAVQNRLVNVRPIYYYMCFGMYILVGFIQLFLPDFLSFLVYRGYQELASTGRGVRSLASEPAVFGNLLGIINILWVFVYSTSNKTLSKTSIIVASLFFLLANFTLAGSFYSISYHAMVVALLFYFTNRRTLVFVLPLISMFLFEAYFLILSGYTMGLGFDRFNDILSMIVTNPLELYEQGAFLRAMNVPISIYGGLLHGVFGAGFGPKYLVYGEIAAISGVPYSFSLGDRAAGGVIEFFLRIGLLSLPILYAYYLMLKKICRYIVIIDHKEINIGKWAAISLFLLGFTYNSMANPLLWLTTFCYFFGVDGARKK